MTSGRAFERFVSFTDAVVAVAITLLVLSIIDIRPTSSEATVWSIISDNAGQITTFTFTFVVVAVMWQVHLRLFNKLQAFDGLIFWFNLLWLIGIVLLPWSSALFGEGVMVNSSQFSGGEGDGGAGMLYWGNMAVISFAGVAIGRHAFTHPELLIPGSTYLRDYFRGLVFGIAFLAIGVLTVVDPVIGGWGALVLIPMGAIADRIVNRLNTKDQEESSDD